MEEVLSNIFKQRVRENFLRKAIVLARGVPDILGYDHEQLKHVLGPYRDRHLKSEQMSK